jgi:transcriptional regulator with GAF, ATPase, and Fis domain
MLGDDLLSEGVRTLLKRAVGLLPANGLGVVRQLGDDGVILTYADPFGATAYRTAAHRISTPFRPRSSGLLQVTAAELDANPTSLVESRLLHTGFSEEIRGAWKPRQVFTVPVPDTHGSTLLVISLTELDRPTAVAAPLESLAHGVTEFLRPFKAAGNELDLLRKLEAVEHLLPALFHVLDVREIFDRLSTIARSVLRHDFASLGVLSEDLEQIDLYVQTSPGSSFHPGGRMPFPPVQTEAWLYRFVDDLLENPLERDMETARAGGRASIRVAVRLEGRTLGALNFTSREATPYSTMDLVIARRIADYVALSLSHHQMAERARLNEQLRTRTATIDLLDALLASLIESGGVHDLFSRISAFAQQVIDHDAIVLWVVLADGVSARCYASAGFQTQLPDVMPVPPAFIKNPNWDHEIVADSSLSQEVRDQGFASIGLQSILRVPVRLDGRFGGTLIFVARERAHFSDADIPTARRIADRIAVTLARDREVAASIRADEATARASKLESRVRALMEELDARSGHRRVVGESVPWRRVLTQATQVAATEATVLLLGESGTGKEVLARFVHRASDRSTGPFVALNCAALPEQLLEAELFGYERGAFTGATQSKPGQLEQAAGGTLFLDEVGEMSLQVQAKFLRVLQEREYQRLGGTRVLRSDARVIAATNRDLPRAIAHGQFREDLYYRLNVFPIQLPPLRTRAEDVLPLSDAFLAEIGRGIGRPASGISRDARKLLTEYHWPGNVRELRNILERATILCEGGLITSEHLALNVAAVPEKVVSPEKVPAVRPSQPTSSKDLQSMERRMIEDALQSARFNKSKAAKALGLTRQQLYLRMHKYGLQ